MFIDDDYKIVKVNLEDIETLVEYTKERVEKAKRVLKEPSDDNLREYNHICEIHDDLRKRTQIYPNLTNEEKTASSIWMARKDMIEW